MGGGRGGEGDRGKEEGEREIGGRKRGEREMGGEEEGEREIGGRKRGRGLAFLEIGF